MSDLKPTPGARLKAQREQRGLSAQKAADEMHLDAWVIDALEAGDYARIGPMVYAKGHLKRYAEMLGLPVAEIMSDFEPPTSAAPAPERSNIPVGSRLGQTRSRAVSPGQAAASLAAVLMLIGVMWWQPWHQRERAPVSSAPSASAVTQNAEPASAADAQAIDGSSPPTLTAQDYVPRAALTAAGTGGGVVSGGGMVSGGGVINGGGMRAAAAGSATAPGATSSGAPTATPATGRARLRLSFTSDSWVDVRDALGNRAFAGNGSANTVKTIAGAAPLHVYLRSASGVQLEINGRAVAIGPQFFSGNVARFEAGADGVLRREQTPARPPG
jgi:cytoskeleton protein RodZ